MADNSYYPQTQGDSSKAEAEKHVTIVNVEIGSGGRVGPYYPGNAKSVVVVATGACRFEVRGGGSPGPANTVYRNAFMQYADIDNPTSAQAGVMTSVAMLHEFYLFDTSGSANPVTIYFNY